MRKEPVVDVQRTGLLVGGGLVEETSVSRDMFDVPVPAVASHLATADDSQNSDFPSLANLVRHPDVTAYIEQQLQKRGLPAATNWLAELDGYRADHLQPIPSPG